MENQESIPKSSGPSVVDAPLHSQNSCVAPSRVNSQEQQVSDEAPASVTVVGQEAENSSGGPRGRANEENNVSHVHVVQAKEKQMEASAPAASSFANPIWLHRGVLTTFALLFVLLASATLLLYEVSRINNGISTQISSNHYSWTYGPTALLVIVAALWHQVEYQCKLLAPWAAMHRGPTDASKSLMLDYLSPILPVVLWKSLRNCHWAVAAASSVSLLLEVCVILSTSLLVLLPTVMTASDVDVPVSSQFSTSEYANSDWAAPGVLYWGLHTQQWQLPFGTTEHVAFNRPDFSVLDFNSGDLSLELPVFISDMNCTVASVSGFVGPLPWLPDGWQLNWTVSTSDCTFSNSMNSNFADGFEKEQFYAFPNNGIQCGGSTIGTGSRIWALALMSLRFEEKIVTGTNGSVSETIVGRIERSSGAICYPYYGIETADITFDVSRSESPKNLILHSSSSDPKRKIVDLSDAFFSNAIATILDESAVGQLPVPYEDTLITRNAENTFFNFMCLSNHNSSIEAFFDSEVMAMQANEVFQAMAAQLANRGFSTSSRDSVRSTRYYSEDRLHARIAIVIVLITIFGLSCISAISIVFNRAWNVVLKRPDSISSLAICMSNSKSLSGDLRACACLPDDKMLARLQQNTYWVGAKETSETSNLLILSSKSSQHLSADLQMIKKWWLPITGKLPVVLITILLPAAVFVALEVLQRRSDTPTGITLLSISRSAASAWSTIIPTSVMAIVKLSVASLAFNVSLFAPFARLRRGVALANAAMFVTMIGPMPVVKVVISLRHKYYGVFLVTVLSILGIFLSIIISGLYSVDTYTAVQDFQARAVDYLVLGFNNSQSLSEDNYAGVFFNAVDQYNVSYPPFIYDQYAFPNLTFVGDDSHLALGLNSDGEQTSVKVEVPVIRGSLDCVVLPSDATRLNFPYGPLENDAFESGYAISWSNDVEVPADCPRNKNSTKMTFTDDSSVQPDIGPNTEAYASVELYPFLGVDGQRQAPGDCFTIGFMIGYFQVNHTSPENVTTLYCNQIVEQFSATATYLVPSMTIDSTNPPIIDQSSRLILTDSATYLLENALTNEISYFEPVGDNPPYNFLSPFFQHAILSPAGVPLEELIGPANHARLLDATQHTYRRYMAHVITRNMRRPFNSTTSTSNRPVYPAQTFASKLRLVQNPSPKIALQVILGMTCILSIIAIVNTPMRKLLPHNPLTIAGTMSLLAGSQLCDELIPPDAETLDDKELRRVFGRERFSLGWFVVRDHDHQPQIGTPEHEHEREGEENVDEQHAMRTDPRIPIPQLRFGIDIGRAAVLL